MNFVLHSNVSQPESCEKSRNKCIKILKFKISRKIRNVSGKAGKVLRCLLQYKLTYVRRLKVTFRESNLTVMELNYLLSNFYGLQTFSYVRICRNMKNYFKVCGRSQWPRGLRRSPAAARLLRLWVRIPPGAWMFVCCECCVLSGRGLCDGLITHPEESYRLWCVVVCDLEKPQE